MNSIDARGRSHGPYGTPAPGWQVTLGSGDSGGSITLVDGPLAGGSGAGIHSAGVDLVEVARIRRAVLRSGEPFVRRVFGERERAAVGHDPDRRIAELAALFGVKESVVKAIGGMPLGGNYADICVDVAASGVPRQVRLRGELGRWARRHRVQVLAGSAPAGEGMLLSWAVALPGTSHAGQTPPAETQPAQTQPAQTQHAEVRS
jgi:holo-[acyl-carrier protein] synthase